MKTSKPLLSNKTQDINSKLNQDELNGFTSDCLKKYCRENSIPIATTKANIITNLLQHFNSISNKSTHNNSSSSSNNKQPLNDSSNIQQPQPQQQQQQQPLKMKSILKKDTDNKENIKDIIDKVENLEITKKNESINNNNSIKTGSSITTRRKALENQQQQQQQQQEKDNQGGNKKKVTFNSVNQIGFIEKKEKNNFKYYINTNQNSPIKNESPLKIVNNQSYNIFDFLGEEEAEFDTENMKIWELKEALETNGLSTDGDKQQLKERLEKFIVETLNTSNTDGNKNDALNDSIDDDWIRWTPLKAKNSKVTSNSISSIDDKKKASRTTKKTIKSKSKPSKKSRKYQDNDEDDQDDQSYDDDDDNDDDDDDQDTPIMNSQQLFNAFIDVSVSTNKKKINK